MPKPENTFLGPMLFGMVITSFGLGCWVAIESSKFGMDSWSSIDLQEGLAGQKLVVVQDLLRSPQSRASQKSCQSPLSLEESALCAQWQGVKSARDTVYLSFWQLLFSGAGVLGVIMSLEFNRRALAAAHEANKQALQIGEAQTKCYLSVESVRVQWAGDTGREMLIGVDVRNYGQSPAFKVNWKASINCKFIDPDHPDLQDDPSYKVEKTVNRDGIVSPGATERFAPSNYGLELKNVDFERIKDGAMFAYTISIEIDAIDIFNNPVEAKKSMFVGLMNKDHKGFSESVQLSRFH